MIQTVFSSVRYTCEQASQQDFDRSLFQGRSGSVFVSRSAFRLSDLRSMPFLPARM